MRQLDVVLVFKATLTPRRAYAPTLARFLERSSALASRKMVPFLAFVGWLLYTDDTHIDCEVRHESTYSSYCPSA